MIFIVFDNSVVSTFLMIQSKGIFSKKQCKKRIILGIFHGFYF
jgi:hypothetical protein